MWPFGEKLVINRTTSIDLPVTITHNTVVCETALKLGP